MSIKIIAVVLLIMALVSGIWMFTVAHGEIEEVEWNGCLTTELYTDRIWIANDVIIRCDASDIKPYQRKVIEWLTGWRYEKVPE